MLFVSSFSSVNCANYLTLVCSVWVMMNKTTRRLSKMPDEVRGEIGPHFNDRSAITEEQGEKLAKPRNKVVDPATKQFIRKGLTVSQLDILNYHTQFGVSVSSIIFLFLMGAPSSQQPKWGDLDVNQHVNNVKYIGWILEVIYFPHSLLFSQNVLATFLPDT